MNPINRMVDGCVSVGQTVWDNTLGGASYDPDTLSIACLSDVPRKDEALTLTTDPNVTNGSGSLEYAALPSNES